MQYHFQKKHVNKYCALVHGYLIFLCDYIKFTLNLTWQCFPYFKMEVHKYASIRTYLGPFKVCIYYIAIARYGHNESKDQFTNTLEKFLAINLKTT